MTVCFECVKCRSVLSALKGTGVCFEALMDVGMCFECVKGCLSVFSVR